MNTGTIDQKSESVLNYIDRFMMPEVLRLTNANIAKPKDELSSRKTN